MSKLIAVDAGHGLHTPGKRTPDGEREWSFNNKVVIALINELHRLGLRTIRLDDPSGQRDVPLGERTRKANNAKADVLVSVHHNALRGVWGNHTGTEIYSYPGSKKSKELADKMQPKLAETYGLRNRGAKTANFHMLRESNMPAILPEGGYMDSRIDIVKLRDEEVLKQAGITIARNVAEWLGVESKVNTQATVKKPVEVKKQASESKTITQMADEVIAGKHGQGHSNRRNSLGISQVEYEKVRAEVNRRAGISSPTPSKPVKKSVSQMADEVIANKHGNGHENRRKSLGISASEYARVRAEVNRRAGVGVRPQKTIEQMAREVVDGKHGNGHANRQRSLGVDNATYQKVRARVNQIM